MEVHLKKGQIIVNRKTIIEHCNTVQNCLNLLDNVMKQPESDIRGKQIAKIANDITYSLHHLEHFELRIPLESVGKKIK